MLTLRGWWLILPLFGLTTLALGMGIGPLILVCFTILGWFLSNWLVFAVKVRRLVDLARIERILRDERGPVRSLWAGQKVEVVARLISDARWSLPFVHLVDRLPALAKLLEGSNRAAGELSRGQAALVSYRIECIAPGHLRFEGLQVQVADIHGFFQRTLFLRRVDTYLISPVLTDVRAHLATLKRFNALPLLGTHRHRRPGSGSELLDLRDYMPGDPPKTIAWKASARRDRLMTKEFESEVPVRCTMFVDVSMSVRVGPIGQNVLARLIEIAAAVVQASGAVKDLTGLCLFEETRVRKMIRPRRGPRHRLEMMAALADGADLPLVTEHVPLDRLVPLAFGLAQEVYPDLLDSDLNAFPSWLPWWSPQPGYAREHPATTAGKRSLWALLRDEWRRTVHLRGQFFAGRLLARRRRQYRWRKQLAAILSVRHGLAPGGLAMLLEDDQACKQHLLRFLAEHQVAIPLPLYDAGGRYLFASPQKLDVLARALLGCVARGRDNELFVLLADLLEVGPHLDVLLQAVQVARARHHRVLVICPWPREVPLPHAEVEGPPLFAQPAGSLQELFFQANAAQLRQAGAHVQRALARLGVPVLFSPDQQAVSMILHHMHRLRLQEGGRR